MDTYVASSKNTRAKALRAQRSEHQPHNQLLLPALSHKHSHHRREQHNPIPKLKKTAKNVILAGVRAVTVHDTTAVDARDLSAQFYLTPDDVGTNRAEACRERLQELNTAVEVAAAAGELTPEFLGQFQVRLARKRGKAAAAALLYHTACAPLRLLKTPSDTHKHTRNMHTKPKKPKQRSSC